MDSGGGREGKERQNNRILQASKQRITSVCHDTVDDCCFAQHHPQARLDARALLTLRKDNQLGLSSTNFQSRWTVHEAGEGARQWGKEGTRLDRVRK